MNKIFTLSLVVLLAACSVSAKQGVASKETRSGGFMGLSTNENFQVDTKDAFKGANNVIIASFKVGFNESKKEQQKAGGGLLGGGFGGKSTGNVKLLGIDNSVRQSITEAAYADFVAKLQAQGINVVDRSAYVASEAYKGAKKYPLPYANDTSSMFSEYGTATYFAPAAFGSETVIFPGEVPEVTGGFAFANPAAGAAEYAEKNKTKIIYVTTLVDFAGSGGHGGSFASFSTLEVGQVVSADQGILGIIGGQAGTFSSAIGNIKMGQPIASNIQYAEVVNTSTDAGVALETAANVFSAVLGGGTNQSRDFEFKADAAKYQQAAAEVLQKANAGFVAEMAKLK